MLPPVALAVALAFQPTALVSSFWALVSIVTQVSFLTLMRWWWGPSLEGGEHGGRRRRFTLGDRRRFETEHMDYGHFEVLRSDYWRNTTAGALMLDRMAYGYVIRHGTDESILADQQVPPRLEPVLMPARSAAEEPKSVLALLHSSTQRQAITFVVFREKRDDLLAAARDRGSALHGARFYEVEELDLDPDLLAPADNVSSQVDVFIGQLCDFPVLEEHPLDAALKMAKGKLIVQEAQLPFPAPVPGYPGRQWARMRVALRDDNDIVRLAEFLNDICQKIAEPGDTTHVVAVQADLSAPPRAIDKFVKPLPGSRATKPGEDAGDLYIPDGSVIWNEDSGAITWRMVASCAPARSNIESDIIDQLPFGRSRFQLAHLNYAVLHGMAVAIVLLHDKDDGAEPEHGENPHADLSQPGVAVNANVSRRELGTFEKCPLLHVRFRWQDRPGALLDVLNSIDAILDDDPPAVRRAARSVSFARVFIASGRIAEGDLTVRIHALGSKPLEAGQLARRISAAAQEASTGRDLRISHESHLDGRQKPVILVDLLGAPLSELRSRPW
jgi:hypothetical protein